ncbi:MULTISPECIES: hypothetical protein [Vibrio]|uniref:Uncharacterized protein n=1 Tax=Vibrio splendidus TaxID=29497 RepID=A0A2N7JJC0_VIBSP|nr:hypothetical protein [Vibrio splendidus]PMM40556.1 hypothetical protein BCT54_12175 [Vibrio splendidus]
MKSSVKLGLTAVGAIVIITLGTKVFSGKESTYAADSSVVETKTQAQDAESLVPEEKQPTVNASPQTAEDVEPKAQDTSPKAVSEVVKEFPIVLSEIDERWVKRYASTLERVDMQDKLEKAKLAAEIEEAQGKSGLGLNHSVPMTTQTSIQTDQDDEGEAKPTFTPIYVDRTYMTSDKPWAEMDIFMTGDMNKLYPVWEGSRYRNIEVIKITKTGVWITQSRKKRFIRIGETE